MRCQHSAPFAGTIVLLLAVTFATGAVADDSATPPLPAWRVLEFEQQLFWLTARSELAVSLAADDTRQWQLTANNSVANNSEQVSINLAAQDGRLLERSRVAQGRDQRYKYHELLADLMVRERRTPGSDPDLPPNQWQLRSRSEIPYPPLGDATVITDAHALLLLAGRFQMSNDAVTEVIVITDFNFYRVRMSHNDGRIIAVNYRLAGTAQAITGRRKTRGVRLQISPLGTLVDDPDFSLLGMEEDIILLFDHETGLPLQIRGNAPRLGPTELNLKSVTLRSNEVQRGIAVIPRA